MAYRSRCRPSTRNAHSYALLHAICATAVQTRFSTPIPAASERRCKPVRKRDVDVLTPSEVDRLAAKMPARLASVVLAAWCGLRWGETSELRRMDVSKTAPPCASAERSPTARRNSYVGEPKTAAEGNGRRNTATHPPDTQSALEEPCRPSCRLATLSAARRTDRRCGCRSDRTDTTMAVSACQLGRR